MLKFLKTNPFWYYWKVSLHDGIKIKYPAEGFYSKHRFDSIMKVFWGSMGRSRKNAKLFDEVETYCMFLGNQRSGHSLVASLLDAHPNIAISHELNALKYWAMGFSRNQVYQLILENAEEYGKRGRGESGYNYVVPNQYQGKHKGLIAIGDKDGRRDTSQLRKFPVMMKNVMAKNKSVKIIVIVRNPFDNITTICLREDRKAINIENIRRYFVLANTVMRYIEAVGQSHTLIVPHQDMITEPVDTLQRMCDFLNLPKDEGFLRDASGIIYKSNNRSRTKLEWTKEMIAEVEGRIAKIPFLKQYSWTSD